MGSRDAGEEQGLMKGECYGSGCILGGSQVWLGGKLRRLFGSAKCHQTFHDCLLVKTWHKRRMSLPVCWFYVT